MNDLVTVICLCYNHAAFVEQAITSVLNQTYRTIRIIIVDDASTDGSREIIMSIAARHQDIKTVLLPVNVGNCRAFNAGLKLATGDFIIDFSTDDEMLPERVSKQVEFFAAQKANVGVVFTNAVYVDEKSNLLWNHYEYLLRKKLLDGIPTGNIFREVLTRYFICSPTMMVRKEVMDFLQGYDESLSYEDFDFWVRASRHFDFLLLNEVLTKVRRSSKSMSTGWYRQGDPQLHSTFLVCQKAQSLCRDEDDLRALRWRVLYEFKQAVFSENVQESKLFAQLLRRLGKIPMSFYFIKVVSSIPLPWARIRRIYHRLYYR